MGRKPMSEEARKAAGDRLRKARAIKELEKLPKGSPVVEDVPVAVLKTQTMCRYVTNPGRKHAFICKLVGKKWECQGESFSGGPYVVDDLEDLDKYETHPLHRVRVSRVH